jgi:hypothetical protein
MDKEREKQMATLRNIVKGTVNFYLNYVMHVVTSLAIMQIIVSLLSSSERPFFIFLQSGSSKSGC